MQFLSRERKVTLFYVELKMPDYMCYFLCLTWVIYGTNAKQKSISDRIDTYVSTGMGAQTKTFTGNRKPQSTILYWNLCRWSLKCRSKGN